jgi:hypothetical protein
VDVATGRVLGSPITAGIGPQIAGDGKLIVWTSTDQTHLVVTDLGGRQARPVKTDPSFVEQGRTVKLLGMYGVVNVSPDGVWACVSEITRPRVAIEVTRALSCQLLVNLRTGKLTKLPSDAGQLFFGPGGRYGMTASGEVLLYPHPGPGPDDDDHRPERRTAIPTLDDAQLLTFIW